MLKCECGACRSCYAREHYRTRIASNPEKVSARNAARRRRYSEPETRAAKNAQQRETYARRERAADKQKCGKRGITLATLDALRVRAGHHCEMPGCINTIYGREEQLDHDHKTGAVRGLLCSACNRSLGHYEKIKAAAELYLQRAQSTRTD